MRWISRVGRVGGGLRPRLAGCLLLLCGLSLAPARPAAADECRAPAGAGFRVDVEVDIPPVRMNRNLNRSQLTQMSFHGPEASVLGLTNTRFEMEAGGDYRHYPLDDGFCFWVERIQVVLSYSNLDIYVASEYATHSCSYRAILAHEQEHAAIARKHIKGYEERIRGALSALSIPKASSPRRVASLEAADRDARRTILRLLHPIYVAMRNTMAKAQAVIDTPQSYRNVRKQCRNW